MQVDRKLSWTNHKTERVRKKIARNIHLLRHVLKLCATELKFIVFHGSDNSVFVIICYHVFRRAFWKTLSTHARIRTLTGLQSKDSCKHVAYSKNRQPTLNKNDDEKKLLSINILLGVAIIFDKLKIDQNFLKM